MSKTKRKHNRWDDEEEYNEGKRISNKRKEKRLKRALKTKDFSMLDEEEDFEEYGF